VTRQVSSHSRGPAAVSADLLARTAKIAADWLQSLDQRPVGASATVDELRARLGGPLPGGPADPLAVVEDLARAAEPGLVAIPSGRYFGFVIGGGLPPRSRPTGSPPSGTSAPASTRAARPHPWPKR
jgi:hypothetical protein